jgi:hypothetical protein
MEVTIGVVYTGKELTFDVEGEADKLRADVDEAVGGDAAVLWLTDEKGRRIGVPTDKIAYVEIGADEASRQVGFGRH